MAKYLDGAGLTRVWGKISSLFARKSELAWTRYPIGSSSQGAAVVANCGNSVNSAGEVAVGMYNSPEYGADGFNSIFTVGCGSASKARNAFLVGTVGGYGSTPHTFISGVGGYDGTAALGTRPVDRILRALSETEIDSIILSNTDNTTPDESW